VLDTDGPVTRVIDQVIALPAAWENAPMTIPTDAFRRFQAELAALDTKSCASKSPMEQAKEEFLALRKRYGLTVADVVTFFPEEEGIAYLQQLIAARTGSPARPHKR